MIAPVDGRLLYSVMIGVSVSSVHDQGNYLFIYYYLFIVSLFIRCGCIARLVTSLIVWLQKINLNSVRLYFHESNNNAHGIWLG